MIRRGGEAARIHQEGDVPPVIDQWRRGEARLAGDLRKAVQRLAGLAPGRKRQFRPKGIPGHRTLDVAQSGRAYTGQRAVFIRPAGRGSTDHWQISVAVELRIDVRFTRCGSAGANIKSAPLASAGRVFAAAAGCRPLHGRAGRENEPSAVRAAETAFHTQGVCLIRRLSRRRAAAAREAGQPRQVAAAAWSYSFRLLSHHSSL